MTEVGERETVRDGCGGRGRLYVTEVGEEGDCT